MRNDEIDLERKLRELEATANEAAARAAEAKRQVRLARQRKRALPKHRDWHLYTLGGCLHAYGLRGEHSDAVEGFLASPMERLTRWLEALDDGRERTIGEAICAAVGSAEGELSVLGQQAVFARAMLKFEDDLRSWREAEPKVGDAWRRKRATREQKFLILRICEAEGVPLPPGKMSRGDASDWIFKHGGNPRFSTQTEHAQRHGLGATND